MATSATACGHDVRMSTDGMNRLALSLVLAGLVLASLAAGAVAIRSYDFGWHIRAGESILDDGGRPPRDDPVA